MRVRLIALIIIGLLLAWVTFASAAAEKTPVDCTIEANVLTCSLPEPSTQVTQTVTADPMTVTPDPVTVTEIPEPVTQIVTATVTATAAPTSTAPATSAAAT